MATTQRQKMTFGGSVTGLSSAPSPGRRAFGAWFAIMSDFPLHWLVFISWSLLV
jgi:hypothetical protein